MQPNQQRHLRLKYELSLVGLSFAEIGRRLGVSHSAVVMVSSGKSRSSRIENAIAEALDCEPNQIWPEYYEDTRK